MFTIGVLLLQTSLVLGAINLGRVPFSSLAGLDKRQFETCEGGCTCFGPNYVTCDSVPHCYDPTDNQICCPGGSWCYTNEYCTDDGLCCPSGETCTGSFVSAIPGGSSGAPSNSPSSAAHSSSPYAPSSASNEYTSSSAQPSSSSSAYYEEPGESSSEEYGYSTSPPYGSPTTPAQTTSTDGFGISPASSSSIVAAGGAAEGSRGGLTDLILGSVAWLLFVV